MDCFIRNVKFDDVIARYINFSGSKINDVKVNECDFTESSFIESSFKNIELMDVKFNKAEFLKTLLKGVDFSSSDITDVMFDLISVKGMIVNQFQCVELVGLLGVHVK